MINHLSYSSISLFLDCPEAWRRKYIAQEKTKSNTALAFGSAFHGTVERIIQSNAQANWQGIWREEFKKSFTDDITLEQNETLEQHYNEGIRMLNNKEIQNTIAQIRPRHDESGAMIERMVELHVPNVPIPIIGYIDIILEDGTLGDFKTSERSWTQEKASSSLQPLFYLAALNQKGFEVNWYFRHYVFVKTKTPQIQIIDHRHKPGEIFFMFETIKRIWDGIRKEYFPLNPTTWRCSQKYCDFYADCRGKYV